MKITLNSGKYEYVSENGNQIAYRHGEMWRDLTGDNFIYAMACKIKELEQERNKLIAQVERLQKIPYTKTRAEFMESWGVEGMSADKKRLANAAWDRAAWFFNQQATLLKAQWQAEAFSGFVSALENIKNEAECSEDILVKTMVEFSIRVTERYLANTTQRAQAEL